MGKKSFFDRERFSRRFLNYPALFMVVRLVLFNRTFRWISGCLMTLVFLGALFVSKIWTTTPDGFQPIIKVSGLDWLQARSLERSAVKSLAAGRTEEGLMAYHLAVANMPTDLDLNRRMITAALLHKESPKARELAEFSTGWILRLSPTNASDLELAARLFSRRTRHRIAAQLLTRIADPRPASAQILLMHELFFAGYSAELDRVVDASPPEVLAGQIPRLIISARKLIRGRGDDSDLKTILDATIDGEEAIQLTANRLLLRVSLGTGDCKRFEAAIEAITRLGERRLIDEIYHWKLLQQCGRRPEARKLASNFDGIPEDEEQGAMLVRVLQDLGLNDRAARFTDQLLNLFPGSENVWLRKYELLNREKNWEGMLQLALAIRNESSLAQSLDYFSHFIEGRALLAQNRLEAGLESLKRCVESEEISPILIPSMADGMLESHQPSLALKLIAHESASSISKSSLWQIRLQAAHDLKNGELLLEAAEQLHLMDPRNLAVANNYAAALLISRKDPAKALEITFNLSGIDRNNTAIGLNHALALIQNHRPEDALPVLARIKPESLVPEESAAYYYARAEASLASGNLDAARNFAARVDSRLLYPSQAASVARILGK